MHSDARITPPRPEDFDEKARDAIRQIEGDRGTGVPWLFQFLLASPELAFRLSRVGEFLRAETTLSDRDREFIILALSRRSDFQLEWSYHQDLARTAGVDDATIEILVRGAFDDLPAADRALVDLAFAIADRTATDPQVDDLLGSRGATGAVEVVVLVAFIEFMHVVVDAFAIGLPEGVRAQLPIPAATTP